LKKLYVLATPIGNFLDLSEHARDVLSNVEAVLAEDTRVAAKLLFKLNIKKPIFSCHKFNETKVSESLNEVLEKYSSVALVSDAGTPAISDPGAIIVEKAQQLNIRIEAVPGASAVVTALSLSGINKTEFAFLGFFPRGKKEQENLCDEIAKNFITTFVLYESPLRIINTLEIIKSKITNINKVCVFNDLTKEYERHYIGSIDKVLEELKNNENANLGEYVFVLDLVKQVKTKSITMSLESLIVDFIIKNNSTIKMLLKDSLA